MPKKSNATIDEKSSISLLADMATPHGEENENPLMCFEDYKDVATIDGVQTALLKSKNKTLGSRFFNKNDMINETDKTENSTEG